MRSVLNGRFKSSANKPSKITYQYMAHPGVMAVECIRRLLICADVRWIRNADADLLFGILKGNPNRGAIRGMFDRIANDIP